MSGLAVLILSVTVLVLAVLLGLFVNKWLKAINEINRKETVIIREKSNRREVGIQYFTEEKLIHNLFSEKHEVRYKIQLLYDNLPIGQPYEFKHDIVKLIDKKQVNKVLDEFAKPLLDAGINVSIKLLT